MFAAPKLNSLGWLIIYLSLGLVTALLLESIWEAIAWSFILAAVTWPAYRQIRRLLRENETYSALMMGLLVIATVLLPFVFIVSSTIKEIGPAYDFVLKTLADPPAPPAWLYTFPALPDLWRTAFAALHGGGAGFGREWLLPLLRPGTKAIAAMGGSLLQGALAFFTLFFLYRNGESYLAQAKAVSRHLFGEQLERLVNPTKEALRAVFAGVILAAVAQGVVAGIGYALVGLRAPILLGITTTALALIPFGAVLVWGTATISLLAAGSIAKGVILALWGILAVSTIDNLVRPLVISGTSRLPYLQTFFAILGGLSMFGLIGLFIGPALLTVWMVLWKEWVEAGAQLEAMTPEVTSQQSDQ